MEYNDCLLDSFSSSITKYCNEVLLHENSVSSTFRKYSVKNEEDIEFSFHLKTPSEFSCSRKLINQSIKSSCLTKEVSTKIILFKMIMMSSFFFPCWRKLIKIFDLLEVRVVGDVELTMTHSLLFMNSSK